MCFKAITSYEPKGQQRLMEKGTARKEISEITKIVMGLLKNSMFLGCLKTTWKELNFPLSPLF